MKALFFSGLCAILLLGCTASKQGNETAAAETNALVTGDFEIISTWANPIGNSALNRTGAQGALGVDSNAGRVNIAGNTNYVRKIGDSLSVYLPYYGTRTTGATPLMETTQSSIIFEGIPNTYTVTTGRNGRFTQVLFAIETEKERYSFLVKVFSKNTVTMDVTATHRNRIQYEGRIEK